MKKNKSKVKFELKIKNSKLLLGTISILFIFFAVLSFLSIKQPLQYEQKSISNDITQNTNISYSTEALPDGMNSINGTIFSKVQKNMDIHVISTVNSKKPVSITGEGTVYYDIIAENLWTYSIPLSDKIKLDLNGSENTIIDSHFKINLDDIKNIINDTEDNIVGTSVGKYTIKIRPDFQANILSGDKTIPLDNTYALSFEYSNGLIKLVEENKEFTSNIPVENLTIKNNEFEFLGMLLPIMLSRYVFSISALILLIVIIVDVKYFKFNKRKDTEEVGYIDKKFGSRLIHLQQEPKFQNKILITISDYKELIKLADDKELNILKYNKIYSQIVVYLVIDGECIFNYVVNSEENNISKLTLGSDALNE